MEINIINISNGTQKNITDVIGQVKVKCNRKSENIGM